MLDLIGKAQAQFSGIPILTPGEIGAAGFETPQVFVLRLANWLLWFAGALVVIYLVYGGIMYITAGGDAEKATKGRTAVINAVIGLIIVLLALIIIGWVTSAIGEAPM